MDEPCRYCKGLVACVSGAQLYKHRPDLRREFFWVCLICEARVGCHPGTKTPLGVLANKELRRLRREAHEEFDRLWKGGPLDRASAYHWLGKHLCLRKNEAHIAMLDEEGCRELIRACRNREYRTFVKSRRRSRRRPRRTAIEEIS